MVSSLGTIRGQMVLDVQQALAAFTAVRLAHLNTVTALATGSGALRSAATGFTIFGGAIAAGFGVALNAAADFERQLSYFGAVSDATEEQMAAVRAEALRLGEDTIYSAGQIGDSFVELAKAGVGAEAIIDGIGESVTNLGAAADIPLDTAANIMMSAVQTFGLGSEEAVRVADLLAGAANASIIEVEDLGVSLKYAGGVASSLGIPIESVIDSLALLGTYGIRGSTAGTSLRQMLVSLGGATGPATKELKRLGIIAEDGSNAFFDETGSAKELSEVFQILQDATAGMSDEQRLASLKTIFQNRALAAAIALTKEGTAGFEEMNAAVQQTTAMDVASERLNNLSGDIEILKGNLETLAISVGSMFQDFARQVVQAVTSVVQWFLNLDEDTQRTILTIIAIVGAVSIVIAGLLLLGSAVLGIINMIIRFRDAMGMIRKGLKAARVAIAGFSTALRLTPVGLIITGITLLVAAFIWLWNNVEGFRNFFIGVWDGIVAAAQAAWAWFQTLPGWFSNLWNDITSGATSAWNSTIAFFASIPGRITAFFSSIGAWFSNLWTTITTATRIAWDAAVAFIGSIPGRIVAFFQQLPYMLGFIIGYAAGLVVKAFMALWTWLTVTVPQIILSVVTWFQQLPARIGLFMVQLWTTITTWLINAWNSAILWAGQIVMGIINWVMQLPGRVAAFFIQLYNNVSSWMSNAAATAGAMALNIYNNIVNWLTQLPGRVLGFFTDVHNNILNLLNQAADTARTVGSNIYNGLIDAITGLPGAVTGIIDRVISAFTDMVGRAFNAVRDFGSGLWEGFKSGLGIASPSYIEHATWAITDTVDEETNRLRGQVRTLQGWGRQLSRINAESTFSIQGNMIDMAAQVANEAAKVKQIQSELASVAAANESSRIAMSRLPNDAWETAYATAGRSARAERNVTVEVPPAEFPPTVQLVDEDGSILAVTRVQTRTQLKDSERRKDLVGKVRR